MPKGVDASTRQQDFLRGLVMESASGIIQSTGRKPGGMVTQGGRRLAPAALTWRTHPAGSVAEPSIVIRRNPHP